MLRDLWLASAVGLMSCAWALGCAKGLTTDDVPGTGTAGQACKKQADCGASSFCEPTKAGSADGRCVAPSGAHCLSCAEDSDCGSPSAVCFQAIGDSVKACHVDCALAGAAACPEDYTCVEQNANGHPRKVCLPKVAKCLDALGGFCDGKEASKPCSRESMAGTCTGERVCLAESKRFDKCSAATPACKKDCSAKEVPGCMTSACAGAATSAENCGTCGNACPGLKQPDGNAACEGGKTCSFSCQGEHYDVDNTADNGCEATDVTTDNHAEEAALGMDPHTCDDGNALKLLDEHLISDQRAHAAPEVTGFDEVTGSAPDWYTFHMDGGLCINDCVVQLKVSGSMYPDCYHLDLYFKPSGNYYGCQTSGGICSIEEFGGPGDRRYEDGDDLYLQVSKTCSAMESEDVTYSVLGHF